MMETLKSDPRAMDIFVEELAAADQTQPKHMKFLANLPFHTSRQFDSPAANRQKFNTTQTSEMQFEHNRISLPDASKRDGLIKTGYNSGFIRGTFAT